VSQAGSFDSGTPLADIETITTDDTNIVGPDGAGNVFLVGGANIGTTGVIANTATINLNGMTDHAVHVGNATASLTALAVGGDNTVLLGNTTANPSWGTVGNAALTNSSVTLSDGNNITVTGSPLSLGGTASFNLTGTTQYAVQVGDATGSLDSLAVGTDGQILIAATTANPAFGTLGSTNGTIDISEGANTLSIDATAGIATDTGFATWGGAGAYFDDTTLGDFELLRPGTGYINGKLIAWTAPQTVTGLTAGNAYLIYIDSAGDIQKTTTYDLALVQDNIVLFECLRDSTPVTNNQITVKENHTYNFQPSASYYCHRVIGTVIDNTDNGANITLNGTQKIQINGADFLTDHGLYTDIPDSAATGVTWNKMYTTAAGKWAIHNTNDTFAGVYNNAGTVDALGAGKFGVYRLYVSKDSLNAATPTYFAVINDAQYNNLTLANAAISAGSISISTNELDFLELAQLGYIIFSEATTSIVSVIISKATLRSTISTTGTNTAALVTTSVTNFNHILGATDTNVQQALETIDDVILRSDAGDAQATAAVFTIAGGTGIATAGAGSTVTINASGAMVWNEVVGTSQAMAVDNGYVCNNVALVTCTLPDTAAFGSVIKICGKGAGGWKIAQNAGESIRWDEASVTTGGVGGSLASTDDHDFVEILCTTANTTWTVLGSKGNILIT